ncbi:hypothetical protein [Geotalea sp. SG265]|uniref:hypothetical protein n=1 Tax=Geotalea sp. SG265 TaxID=2922867 RepID=UPI001FAE7C25|nr:hypothetical protein [Geotalea sp. SG265]
MQSFESTVSAAGLMLDFAGATGLTGSGTPRRYLWTDAFAICNYLDLFTRSQQQSWLDLALQLVDQVHHILGRHRPDNARTGWISGLSEPDGERHPTVGGLRIGKELPERSPGERYDGQLEWERDGQYYHYLTKWMHALSCVARATGNIEYLLWAIELAKVAHGRFTAIPERGNGRMYWKMNIDLTRPAVTSMGQHDPLDGLVTYSELQACSETAETKDRLPALDREIEEMARLCRSTSVATDDPLGLGGLLFDAGRMMQLTIRGKFHEDGLLERVLDAILEGLVFFDKQDQVQLPAAYRLAFRELGLSIGLHGLERMRGWLGSYPEQFSPLVTRRLEQLARYLHLGNKIEQFWLEPAHRKQRTWSEHRDINQVMLATSLAPDGFLTA